MRKATLLIKLLILVLSLLILSVNAQTNRNETWQGKLILGKQDSAIIYYGTESGDLAAFCFRNKSAVGRAIFSKCRKNEQCKFTGRVSTNGDVCNTAYEYIKMGGYSFTGEIVSLKSVRKILRK